MYNHWLQEQINRYKEEYHVYKEYSEILAQILEKVCDVYVPHAIVQARPKSIASFAEKAIRKQVKYSDPAVQFTDLCGVRVITHTTKQVDIICEFIRNNFYVDSKNSVNTSSRLKENEFGYLSNHFIVTIPQNVGTLFGIRIPEAVKNKKAELQVRTILQHAWSDITHKRVYKSPLNIPEPIKRNSARLAALMENADALFSHFAETIDTYQHNYTPYTKIEDIHKEIEILQTVLVNEQTEDKKPEIALRLANIAAFIQNWDIIIQTLEPYSKTPIENNYLYAKILLSLGRSICSKFRKEPACKEYIYGQKLIKGITKLLEEPAVQTLCYEDNSLQAKVFSVLAWTYNNQAIYDKAHAYYLKAYELDPTNPYYLADCIDKFIGKTEYLPLLKTTLNNAIRTCLEHIQIGLELPKAYFVMGRFHFINNEYYSCLEAYIKAVDFCLTFRKKINSKKFDDNLLDAFNSELSFFNRTCFSDQESMQINWIKKVLHLGRICLFQDPFSKAEINQYKIKSSCFSYPVLIIAGSDNEFLSKTDLKEILTGYKGSIIALGKDDDIPGIVEELTMELNDGKYTSISLIQYFSKNKSYIDPYPDKCSHGHLSTLPLLRFGECIQCWVDLVSQDIMPENIVVLGINGVKTAALEYQLAIALGARVGLVDASGGAAAKVLADNAYTDNKNLLKLPCESMIIRAFIIQNNSSLEHDIVEEAAKAVHHNYLVNTMPKEDSLQPWIKLRSDLKESNKHFVMYMEEILRRCGYGIRWSQSPNVVKISSQEIEVMAEMEHGRWVIEKLLQGWTYDEIKDDANKRSPNITTWANLDKNMKEYNCSFVEKYPEILASVGLEVYKLEGH